jgi:translation elongation factor EF-Tu-like GTPase
MTEKNNRPRYKAFLQLIRTEDGGRQTGIRSMYWTQFTLGETRSSCCINKIETNTEMLLPGESANVEISVLFPDRFPNLTNGTRFAISEGLRIVGQGEITSVASCGPDTGCS